MDQIDERYDGDLSISLPVPLALPGWSYAVSSRSFRHLTTISISCPAAIFTGGAVTEREREWIGTWSEGMPQLTTLFLSHSYSDDLRKSREVVWTDTWCGCNSMWTKSRDHDWSCDAQWEEAWEVMQEGDPFRQ